MEQYVLGIIWSVSSLCGEKQTFRHKDKYFTEILQNIFGGNIYCQKARTNMQYVLKLSAPQSITLLAELKELGYTHRNSDSRRLPIGADREFIKAYLELHSGVDSHKGKARLRIYGNAVLIEEFNHLISSVLDICSKKPQIITAKTHYLSYASQSEIQSIYDEFAYDEIKSCTYWDNFRNILEKGEH